MAKFFQLLTLLTSTLIWFALAVAGWGGSSAFFAHPARTALAVLGVALAGLGMFSEAGLRPGVREDRGNRWIFAPLLVIGLLSAWLPPWSDRNGLLTLDGDTARWIGVLLFAAGGVLRLAPVFVLGRRFSGLVAIQPDHELVTSGLYGVIRHPSYLGLIVMLAGWGLAFRSVLGLLLAASLVFPLLARIHAEETLLAEQFGEKYAAYRARTYRLIPGIY
ncbi:MAG TPA: isoprenylcysteine carboxylmethyltransferase family protein [Methylocystis sp.]|nr:isoprenylcysteine carboxylmethyltransferase family protein [Methylocystis sp.]